MQQTHHTRSRQFINAVMTVAWIFGLLLAGSDSPYMPWANVIGLILFTAAGLSLSRRLRCHGQVKAQQIPGNAKIKSIPSHGHVCKKSHRIKVRFA